MFKKMHSKKIKFDDCKEQNNEYFYKYENWRQPSMNYLFEYDLTIIKSCIENYDKNVLFEYLNVINIIVVKQLIASYLLVKNINMSIISSYSSADNNLYDYDCYYIIIIYDNKKYKFKYCCNNKSIKSFYVVSLSDKLLFMYHKYEYYNITYSMHEFFEDIKKSKFVNEISMDDLDAIYDVLVVFDKIIKEIKVNINI